VRPLPLPCRLTRYLDGAARDLLQPPDGPAFDFATPAGEPALVGPASLSWRIFKNPVSLFVGGVAAVILELAEPRVRTGVWEHTSFRDRPGPRLQRTGLAAMVTVYGARSRAEAMIAGVVRAHERVRGTTPDGRPYRANDPVLLRWVQATALWGFVTAYDRWVRPLRPADFDRLYAEGVTAARLYGVADPPASRAAVARLFRETAPTLEPSPIVTDFLRIVRAAPILPPPLRPLQPALVRAAVALVPEEVRAILALPPGWLPSAPERAVVRTAGALAERVVLPSGPAARSCLRLGLPADHLYRG